jgi:muramoyltetrapeptide carboxypeptidase LdcA involved in peptidoglycan recycling
VRSGLVSELRAMQASFAAQYAPREVAVLEEAIGAIESLHSRAETVERELRELEASGDIH